jgi:CO/xanthine dehydrogenase FAD-binding subunit
MAAQSDQIFFPASLSELFSVWTRFPGAVLYAGGTSLLRGQCGQIPELPPLIISLDKINELDKITRTERYLELGAMVKLNQIILLGKIVPGVLKSCLEQIAGSQIRNIATIGGNICNRGQGQDTIVPLVALDAQYELYGLQSARWVSAARFSSLSHNNALNPHELVSRIRIPLDQWDYSIYRKFSGPSDSGGTAVFMIKNQKNVLTDIRVVFKANTIIRDTISKNSLIGKQLPLNRKIAGEFLEKWENFSVGIPEIDGYKRKRLLNFIDVAIHNLSE